MKVMNIIQDSIVDGEGLRTVIFFAGCSHFCKGCHNPSSWNINNGVEVSLEEILKEVKKNPLNDVTFSGGDPIYQVKELVKLAKEIKKLDKNIWCYTGYTIEELRSINNKDINELLETIDVLVDGRFEIDKLDLSIPFRGSTNQRIIYLK